MKNDWYVEFLEKNDTMNGLHFKPFISKCDCCKVAKLSKQKSFLLNKRIDINNSTLLLASLPKQPSGVGISIKEGSPTSCMCFNNDWCSQRDMNSNYFGQLKCLLTYWWFWMLKKKTHPSKNTSIKSGFIWNHIKANFMSNESKKVSFITSCVLVQSLLIKDI